MTVIVRVSTDTAKSLIVGQEVAVVETMTPNETALSLLRKFKGVVLVFDHGYLSTSDGFFLGKEPPKDIPLQDKMIVTSPKVGEGKRRNLVIEMINQIQRANKGITSGDEMLTLYIVGEPTAVWGAIRAAEQTEQVNIVYVAHSEADYGEALFEAIRPDPDAHKEIAYQFELDMLPSPRTIMDRIKIKWDELSRIEDIEEVE